MIIQQVEIQAIEAFVVALVAVTMLSGAVVVVKSAEALGVPHEKNFGQCKQDKNSNACSNNKDSFTGPAAFITTTTSPVLSFGGGFNQGNSGASCGGQTGQNNNAGFGGGSAGLNGGPAGGCT